MVFTINKQMRLLLELIYFVIEKQMETCSLCI